MGRDCHRCMCVKARPSVYNGPSAVPHSLTRSPSTAHALTNTSTARFAALLPDSACDNDSCHSQSPRCSLLWTCQHHRPRAPGPVPRSARPTVWRDLCAQHLRSVLRLLALAGHDRSLLCGITGDQKIFVNSYALQNEVSDEKRFRKKVTGALQQLRNAAPGDGLFTVRYPLSCLRISDADSITFPCRSTTKSRTGILLACVPLLIQLHATTDDAFTDRLLMPCFGAASIHNMFDDMVDVVSQLVLKWER